MKDTLKKPDVKEAMYEEDFEHVEIAHATGEFLQVPSVDYDDARGNIWFSWIGYSKTLVYNLNTEEIVHLDDIKPMYDYMSLKEEKWDPSTSSFEIFKIRFLSGFLKRDIHHPPVLSPWESGPLRFMCVFGIWPCIYNVKLAAHACVAVFETALIRGMPRACTLPSLPDARNDFTLAKMSDTSDVRCSNTEIKLSRKCRSVTTSTPQSRKHDKVHWFSSTQSG